MDILQNIKNLEIELENVSLPQDMLLAIKFVSLVYLFKEQTSDCNETNDIYRIVLNFLDEHFGIKDAILLEKNCKFDKTHILINNIHIKDGSYEEFEVEVTDEKSLIFRFLREQMVSDIKLFNNFLHEVSLLLKNRFLSEELAQASFKDSITGLYNRMFLVEHLKQLVPLTLREGKNLGVLMIAIDHFKAVMDEFDYEIGDRVLKKLAVVLTKHLRQSDLIVKYSGDEFIVILANIRSEEDAMNISQKLVDAFASAEVETVDGYMLKKSICIGLSMFPNDSQNIEQIFKNADVALYEAKNLGRSKVLRFCEKQVSSIELF